MGVRLTPVPSEIDQTRRCFCCKREQRGAGGGNWIPCWLHFFNAPQWLSVRGGLVVVLGYEAQQLLYHQCSRRYLQFWMRGDTKLSEAKEGGRVRMG
jgi:hypothetical protein